MKKIPKLLLLALLLLPLEASPTAAFKATADGVVVILYTESCALKEVTNLKNKATWLEKGKLNQGCWGASPIGVILLYFDDKTVAAIPVQLFERITET